MSTYEKKATKSHYQVLEANKKKVLSSANRVASGKPSSILSQKDLDVQLKILL